MLTSQTKNKITVILETDQIAQITFCFLTSAYLLKAARPLILIFSFLPHIYMGTYMISEKAVAPHSSTLAWKIPWTEEPDGLQSMGSLRVGHN